MMIFFNKTKKGYNEIGSVLYTFSFVTLPKRGKDIPLVYMNPFTIV